MRHIEDRVVALARAVHEPLAQVCAVGENEDGCCPSLPALPCPGTATGRGDDKGAPLLCRPRMQRQQMPWCRQPCVPKLGWTGRRKRRRKRTPGRSQTSRCAHVCPCAAQPPSAHTSSGHILTCMCAHGPQSPPRRQRQRSLLRPTPPALPWPKCLSTWPPPWATVCGWGRPPYHTKRQVGVC